MKKISNFNILFSMTVLFILTACVQEENQSHATLIPNDDVELSNRGDCDECPGANECCCVIEWLSGAEGYFSICGTSDGDAVTCTASSSCENDIDGLEHTSFQLDDGLYEEFCMEEDMAFRIQRTNTGTGTVYARVSCTSDQGSPQWKLVSFTPGARVFFDVDDDCLLTECN